ncbi:MAG: putative 4-mercaptohistidine N1-methyltransferase [Chthoniobacterales bacterium]|nr:putative 4-mercaptohistidine N1-methyltransferase [Chthoniobacterales bacterium]
MSNAYETSRLVAEYLFFHYAEGVQVADGHRVPTEALDFPVRVVTELRDPSRPVASALDVGCAVGRSSFELARFAASVIGVDFSSAFIQAAGVLQRDGHLTCPVVIEGERTVPFTARVPAGVDVTRVRFERGDATALRPDIGSFDLVLAVNLLCRLPQPRKFLQRLPGLVAPGGQLLLTTPFSWLPEYTERDQWIGGTEAFGPSWEALCELLEPDFELCLTKDMPFLIREHGRKFQYGIPLGSRWIRKA